MQNFKIGDEVIIKDLNNIACSFGYKENKPYKIVDFKIGQPMLETCNDDETDLLLITKDELQYIELVK